MQAYFTLNKVVQLINQPLSHPITSSPVATGKPRSNRCGYTRRCSCRPALRRLRLYDRSLLTGEVMFGSCLNVWAALSRIALLTLATRRRARKGAPNIACSTSPWPAYRSRRGPLSMRSKQESKKKKYLWTSPHGTSTRLLTGTTQIDLINVTHLSLLNLPSTKSTYRPQ